MCCAGVPFCCSAAISPQTCRGRRKVVVCLKSQRGDVTDGTSHHCGRLLSARVHRGQHRRGGAWSLSSVGAALRLLQGENRFGDAPRSCRRSEELRCSSTPSASRSPMALTEFTGGKGQNSSDFILQQRHQSPAVICTSADPRNCTQNVLQEQNFSDRFLPSPGSIVSSLAGSRSAEHRLVGH